MKNSKETEKQKIGKIGEDIACRFLMKRGFKVIERNYLKKWGEIDIIAKKDKILRFIEVKTVSRENVGSISRETEGYRPEENVHPKKLQRMARVIQTYLIEKGIEDENWQFDVLAIYLDLNNKEAKCRFTEDIILLAT
ncbi:YraN family protein [Patescibacteria group bacterium]|nr:YraN family protein [Patescibacteria group bacterium]